MNKINNEYYIESQYTTLAGPYDTSKKKQKIFMENVISDLQRGNIDYRIVNDGPNDCYVERRGMILPIRK